MNREPIYHKENHQFRIVSMPNGLWVAQMLEGELGDPTNDPWTSLHSPGNQEAAIAYMYMRCPVKDIA